MNSTPNIIQAGQLSALWRAHANDDSPIVSIPINGTNNNGQFLTIEDKGIEWGVTYTFGESPVLFGNFSKVSGDVSGAVKTDALGDHVSDGKAFGPKSREDFEAKLRGFIDQTARNNLSAMRHTA